MDRETRGRIAGILQKHPRQEIKNDEQSQFWGKYRMCIQASFEREVSTIGFRRPSLFRVTLAQRRMGKSHV